MAVAVDASTPALAAGSNDPWTTASFTPPNDSLLVAVVMGDWFNGTPSINITSTGLTFTSRARAGASNNGLVEIFTAPVGSNGGSARTVAATTSLSSDVGGLKVYVITGAAETFLDGSATGTSSADPLSIPVSTTRADTLVLGGVVDWDSLGAPTSSDTSESFDDADLSLMCVRKASAQASPGSVTLNADSPGSGPTWAYAAIGVSSTQPVTPDPVPLTVPATSGWVTGSTSVNLAYSENQAGDRLYMVFHAKQTTAAGTTIATPVGWTLLTQSQGGPNTAPGNGTGSTRLAVFYRDVTTPLSGTLSYTIANGNSSAGMMWTVRPDPTFTDLSWENHDVAVSSLTSGSTSLNVTFSSATQDWGPEDLAAIIVGTSDDTSDPFTLSSVSRSGLTIDTPVKAPDPGYGLTTGNDSGGCAWYARVTAGTSTGGLTIVGTQNTAETAHRMSLRIGANGTPPGANHSGSVSLSGAGALTGSATITASGASTLSGAGGITIPVRTPGVEGVVLPTGSGTLGLSGFQSVAHSGSVDLTGNGTLGGTPDDINALGTFASTGAGSLGLTRTVGMTGTRAFTGAGSLTGTGTPAHTGVRAFTGAGSLALQAVAGLLGSLARTGDGSLTSAGTLGVEVNVSLSGSGNLGLSGEGTESFGGTVELSGEGALEPAQTGMSVHKATALAGQGALTGSATISISGSAAFSGAGSLSNVGSPGHRGSVATAGSGALSGTGSAGVLGALSASGAGSVAGQASQVTVSATLARSGGSIFVLATGAVGTVVLSGTGGLVPSAVLVTLRAPLDLSGAGSSTWSGLLGVTGSTGLSGGSSLDASGTPGALAVLALAGDGTLSVTDVLVGASADLLTSGEGSLSLDVGVAPYLPDLQAVIVAPIVRASVVEGASEATIIVDMAKAVIVDAETEVRIMADELEAVL